MMARAWRKPTHPIKVEVSPTPVSRVQGLLLETMRSVLNDYADAGRFGSYLSEFLLTMHAHARKPPGMPAAQRMGHGIGRSHRRALPESRQVGADGKIDPWFSAALNKRRLGPFLQKEMKDPAIDAAWKETSPWLKSWRVNQTPTFFVTPRQDGKGRGVVQYPIMRRYLDYYLGH